MLLCVMKELPQKEGQNFGAAAAVSVIQCNFIFLFLRVALRLNANEIVCAGF